MLLQKAKLKFWVHMLRNIQSWSRLCFHNRIMKSSVLLFCLLMPLFSKAQIRHYISVNGNMYASFFNKEKEPFGPISFFESDGNVHKPVKQLQFSAVERKKGIPVNSDKDLFYSRYEYMHPATGSVLRNIYHVSTYDRKGDFCKKRIKLSLVDRVPQKEVQIPNVIIPLSGMQALQLIRKGYRGQDLSK